MPKRPFSNPFPERGVSLAFSLPSWFFADPRKQAESSCRLFSAQGWQGNCSLEVFWMVDWGIPRLDLCLKRENPPKSVQKVIFFRCTLVGFLSTLTLLRKGSFAHHNRHSRSNENTKKAMHGYKVGPLRVINGVTTTVSRVITPVTIYFRPFRWAPRTPLYDW